MEQRTTGEGLSELAAAGTSMGSAGRDAKYTVSAADLQVYAETVMESIFRKLEREGHFLHFPSEIIWLNGAPGSGKGTNTPFILMARGLSTKPIVMSDLLKEKLPPNEQALVNRGEMLPDREVVETLLRELLRPENRQGVLVDGFPRTVLQVECLKLLHEKMNQLRQTSSRELPRPKFLIVVLYVSQEESVRRQLRRGVSAQRHNDFVREMGSGSIMDVRPTDLDEHLVRKRYQIFRDHRDTLMKLRDRFQFAIIDAEDSLANVQERILDEFKYQSAQELQPVTYDLIAGVPLADRIRENARPKLVARLDSYARFHKDMFQGAVDMVVQQFIPLIHSGVFAGSARVVMSELRDSRWENSLFIAMCVDILSERGYRCMYNQRDLKIPSRVDLATGEIHVRIEREHHFVFRFPSAHLQRGTNNGGSV